MKANHPGQETLALLAGGDLGAVARWTAARHVRHCDACQTRLDEFTEMRSVASELSELPEVPWNRLASEMKANIRLGLAAGECVPAAPFGQPAEIERRSFFPARSLVAYASIAALVAAGLWVQRPAPQPEQVAQQSSIVLEATAEGIGLSDGGQSLMLMHPNGKDVTFTVGAQGSMRARYVDSEAGYVRINNVYVE